MADLIDRQAAIDAVKKNTFRLTFAEEQNCEGHVAWSAEAVYSDVMEGALLDLPSAQPEQRQRHGQYEQDGRRGAGMSWISREDLMEWLETEEDEMREIDDREAAHEASYIRKHVMEMPKEDVKPVVQAHWDVIDTDSEGDEAFTHVWATLRCSNCGAERSVEDDYVPQYCEGCGAKMEEQE